MIWFHVPEFLVPCQTSNVWFLLKVGERSRTPEASRSAGTWHFFVYKNKKSPDVNHQETSYK